MNTTHQTLREDWLKEVVNNRFWQKTKSAWLREGGILQTIEDFWIAKMDVQQKDFEARLEGIALKVESKQQKFHDRTFHDRCADCIDKENYNKGISDAAKLIRSSVEKV